MGISIFCRVRWLGKGPGKELTTQSKWLILLVNAWLTSSSFGGSTGSEQLSSEPRSSSSPFLVTHGCSCKARLWR
jgi:hypothetical protein